MNVRTAILGFLLVAPCVNHAAVLLDPVNFVSLGSFVSTGNVTVTTSGTPNWPGIGNGVIDPVTSCAVFTFTDFTLYNPYIGSAYPPHNIYVIGTRPIAILVKGNATIGGTIRLISYSGSYYGGEGGPGGGGGGGGGAWFYDAYNYGTGNPNGEPGNYSMSSGGRGGGPSGGMGGVLSAAGGGGGYLGAGGAGGQSASPGQGGSGGAAHSTADVNSTSPPFRGGSGGGGGGTNLDGGGGGGGGGAIQLVCSHTITAQASIGSGAIEADGAQGTDGNLVYQPTRQGGGGGSGGVVVVAANRMTGYLRLSARGGLGGDYTSGGGGGGGGCIALYVNTMEATLQEDFYGGSGGYEYGASGQPGGWGATFHGTYPFFATAAEDWTLFE